jgi:hypothetical protein
MQEKVRKEKILILAKTYPSPSAQYVETSCVAGVNSNGEMRRLFPVPFRMIEHGQQFSKWQWIDVRVEKANKDHRPESHRLYVDTISCGERIETKGDWSARRAWLDKVPSFDTYQEMDACRLATGQSLGLLRPTNVRLEIRAARSRDWSSEELAKLMPPEQGNLFDEAEARAQIKVLQKIPYDFYYVYTARGTGGDVEHCHKIVDWEAGALYLKCRTSHGPNWERPFRAMMEETLIGKDLMFLMGNQHRFPAQWLLISLIYPPKRTIAQPLQASLF